MNHPRFCDPSDLWLCDGALRDVYLNDVSLSDWDRLISVATGFEHRYKVNGIAAQLPDAATIFTARDVCHLLTVIVGSVQINCHFFVVSEIELDIDPREIQSEADHRSIFEFLEQLGLAIGKKLTVTPENSSNHPFVAYDPQHQKWTVFPC